MNNNPLFLLNSFILICCLTLFGKNASGQCGYTCGAACPAIPTASGPQTVVYCTPGTCTFTVPSDVASITVEVHGAGGGGGGAYARNSSCSGFPCADACAGAGGGGGGGYTGRTFAVTAGQTYTVVVGQGGAGGTAATLSSTGINANSGTPGVTGGSSSFVGNGFNLLATGGVGGRSASSRVTDGTWDSSQYAQAQGGQGGTGSGGTSNYSGGWGSWGYPNGSRDYSSAGGGGAGTTGNGGDATGGTTSIVTGAWNRAAGTGASCHGGNGGAGVNRLSNGATNGTAGSDRGGGGSGAVIHTNSTTTTYNGSGGVGANGLVIIRYVSALAVTLSDFSVACGTGRTVYWTTESELNIAYFIVERSRDGINWEEVGRANAVGSSSTQQEYSIDDVTVSYGSSYYRLKQVDFDGKIYINDIVASDCSADNGIVVYPNPAQNNFVLEINSDISFETTAAVYDLNGKVLIQKEVSAKKGISKVYFDAFQLSGGAYFVKLIGGETLGYQPIKLIVNP